jgi:hypothetical protein
MGTGLAAPRDLTRVILGVAPCPEIQGHARLLQEPVDAPRLGSDLRWAPSRPAPSSRAEGAQGGAGPQGRRVPRLRARPRRPN